MINVLLIDNHECLAQGIKLLLEEKKTIKVTIITDSRIGFEQIKKTNYDIILLDLYLTHLNGFELSKQILHYDPNMKILIFTGGNISAHFNMLVDIGVCGFISKESPFEKVNNTIECAARGETIIPIELFQQLRKMETTAVMSRQTGIRDITLKEREQRIILAISEGLTNREIAEKLLVSQRAIEYTLTEIYNKLNVKSRTEALLKASRYSLITLKQIST